MKICILNKFFSTLGGGERHIGAIAEILAARHEVYMIHCGPIEKKDLSARLNLDLQNVCFLDLGQLERQDARIIEMVNALRADLFINATHQSDLFVPGIPNIVMVFFPKYIYPKKIDRVERFKFLAGRFLFNEYDQTVEFEKFYNPEHL